MYGLYCKLWGVICNKKFHWIIFIMFKVKNADFFRAYITEDFDHYVTRKRRQNCHGNHIEMIALSELYNRPIEVYEYSIGRNSSFSK